MDQEKLHTLLAELDRELKASRTLDARSQALLQQVLADIPGSPPGSAQHRTAESELREMVLRFESEHPRLSGVLGQLADALGKLGI